ncbi:hypothetical protein [Desulfosarcina ovata]|uniref:Uncharacterized protein n=2 Tax=Desulfosarcina ovata TaxID=83564 RepID=A0A5K8AJT9_9BACT|nr:hypothetical protein [Desulfosarcina ovata]BBO85178.1 hypothetical protein DSCO28_57440 [Desulfosarcina ovata subsp. sediminis]BBO91934.1 hypothetical protein DSCOOX_51140 [Desulfosarcina ovata subsp. ovata]
MNSAALAKPVSGEDVGDCPYCGQQTVLSLPDNYAPVYVYCSICGKKFIAERLEKGVQLMTLESAPCFSDPDCRDIEMGGGDEE